MKKILAINGSYREDGITDQAISAIVAAMQGDEVEVEVARLRDYPIEFCFNCRSCTQAEGDGPGECIQEDGMQTLIEKIEQADGYIIASPTNLSSVTAIFKRFMERLIVYAYWPWGTDTPKFRKEGKPRKPAVLVSSCAAPGLLGRFVYSTHNQLKMTAKVIGAESVGTLYTGLIAREAQQQLPERVVKKATKLAGVLMNR